MSRRVNPAVNERPVGQPSDHARHDRLLVVRFAAADATGPDYEQARAQIDTCADCASLAADIATLHSSMAALPAAKRTRDFRLTQEQADQLRGSAFDRFLRRLAMPSLALLRPVAGVGVALGLVIAVVGAGLPNAFLPAAGALPPQALNATATTSTERANVGSPADRPSATYAESTGDGVDTAAQPTGTPMPASAPSKSGKAGGSDYLMSAEPTSTDGFAAVVPVPTATPQPESATPGALANGTDAATLLVYGGVTLAVLAFGLLLLSVYARRRTEDPLLR